MMANKAPTARLSGPSEAPVGQEVYFDGSASTDPDTGIRKWSLLTAGGAELVSGRGHPPSVIPARFNESEIGEQQVLLRVWDIVGTPAVSEPLDVDVKAVSPTPEPVDCVLGDEFITSETPLEVCQPDGFQAVEVAWKKPVLVEPAHGGEPCGQRSGTRIEKRACQYTPSPVDCVLGPEVSGQPGPWGTCQPNGTQTRTVPWTKAIVIPPAHGGAPCGPTSGTRTETKQCVYVPPIPPTGNHGYFDALVARPDHWKSYSLRSQAMLDQLRHGWLKAQTYDPAHDTYHSPQDGAKISVAPYIPQRWENNPVVLTKALNATEDVITSSANGPGITYKIDNEIMAWVATVKDAAGNIIGTRVARAVHGSTPAPHSAGTEIWRSINATFSQIRLPLGTERGHQYLYVWDAWAGPEVRRDISGMTGWKTYQFAQKKDAYSLEIRSRMLESSSVVLAPDEVFTVDMRAYAELGPGIGNEPITPRQEFRVKASTRTRYFVLLDHTMGDWDYLSLWMADTMRDPVRLLDRIPFRSESRVIAEFWLEFGTSLEPVKPGRPTVVSYVYDFWVGRDVVNLSEILVKP